LTAGGITQMREIAGGGSYLSQSDLRAHFGLGSQTRAETIEIAWPSGQKQVLRNVDADRFLIVKEGSGIVQ
jgi:enediyne biosynthesis protein E4